MLIEVTMGHFRVAFCLRVKTSPGEQKALIWKWGLLARSLFCKSNSFSYDMKGCVPGLVLKQRSSVSWAEIEVFLLSWGVLKRIFFDAFSPIVHTTPKTLIVLIENAYIENAVQSGDIWKRISVDGENGGFWKRLRPYVIRLFVACADDYCSVFERGDFKRKRISVDGENAAKTIVWTDTFLVKTERFENGAKRKRISLDGAPDNWWSRELQCWGLVCDAQI